MAQYTIDCTRIELDFHALPFLATRINVELGIGDRVDIPINCVEILGRDLSERDSVDVDLLWNCFACA